MASADEGDRGLWVGPSDSGTNPAPGERANPVEPDPGQPPAPINTAVTQLMPLVVAPTSGPPVVRGIARRAAVALPALGGTDGPRDAPLSARATVDRRRAAAQAGTPRPAPATSASAPTAPTGATVPAPRFPEPSETVTAVPAPPALWRLPAPEPAPQPAPGAFGRAVDPVEAAFGTGAAGGDVVARVSGGTDVALAARHARTAPATLSTVDTGEIPVVAEPDPIRTLPRVFDADSWDSAPDAQPRNEDYLGRRRATALPLRIWLIIGLVLLGLGAAIVIPLVLGSPSTPKAGVGTGQDLNAAPTGFIPHNEGELISAASSPGAQPSRSAGPGSSPTGTAALGPTTTPPATTTPPVGSFSLTLNAVTQGAHQSWQVQANTVCGSGQVVLTGRWEGQASPGTLTYSSVNVPATGNYFMTIYWGTSAGADRTEEIRVNNASVNTGGSFPIGCKNRKIQVSFTKTTGNTITFTNQNSRGISISQIVISTS